MRQDIHQVTRRMNVAFGAMVVATIFALVGAGLIGLSDGMAPFKVKLGTQEWEIQSAPVGVVLIFSTMILVTATLFYDRKKKHEIFVKHGDKEVNWSGVFTTIEELDTAERFLLEFFSEKGPNQPPETTTASVRPRDVAELKH